MSSSVSHAVARLVKWPRAQFSEPCPEPSHKSTQLSFGGQTCLGTVGDHLVWVRPHWTFIASLCSTVCVCAFVMDFNFSLPANPPSILSGGDTALSWLRQLETIMLNQQAPAHFQHTKKTCTFSKLILPKALHVCVCFYVSAWLFLLHVPRYLSQTFFFPLSNFSSTCTSLCLQLRSSPIWIKKEVRLKRLDPTYQRTASLSLCLPYPQLIIYSYQHKLVSVMDISFKARAKLP